MNAPAQLPFISANYVDWSSTESASNMQAALNFCWKVSRKLPIWTNTLTTHISVKVSEKKPLVLWNCWLGIRKSIRPVKIEWWGVNVVVYLERGADCLHTVQLMPLPSQTPSSLASFKSRLVLPFWYRLIHTVLERRPLNRCCSSNSSKWRKQSCDKQKKTHHESIKPRRELRKYSAAAQDICCQARRSVDPASQSQSAAHTAQWYVYIHSALIYT